MKLENFLNERDEKRRQAFAPNEDCGLFLSAAKCLFGWEPLDCCWRNFARRKLGPKLKDDMSGEQADSLIKRTLELYSVVTMAVLLGFYTAFYCMKSFSCPYATWPVAILGTAVALYRVTEIFSFLVQLHTGDDYFTTRRMRAVFRTVWNYLECLVAFGTLYMMAYLFGDSFASQSPGRFLESWITPLYFSFVTITTLGYGDFSPQCGLGRLLVMVEVFLGLILFLVVLQRALSAPANSPCGGTQGGVSGSA